MADRLPRAIRETAERLARQERRADDGDAARLRARREALLGEYGFTSRIRHDENRSVLVCYPSEWIDSGTIDRDAIDDLERAVELPLDAVDDDESWSAIAAENRQLAARIRDLHGPVHGANADAFVAFMNNHRARSVRQTSDEDVEEFLAEYYPRNAWPSESERAVVEESIELLRQSCEHSDA